MVMIPHIRHYSSKLLKHRYGLTFAAYIASAFTTGIACVAFMRLFAWADSHRLDFARTGWMCLVYCPLLFLFAVFLVKKLSPYAAGSGIPQAIFIVRRGDDRAANPVIKQISSPLTMVVKIVSILAAVWAGASVGREGPTVQIAVCVFFISMGFIAKFFPITASPRSMAVAGGAAGLAAAFNTPLAGVTFAVEELAGGYFENIKDYVLMAIVVAAISAKILTGDYVYFGKLKTYADVPLSAVLVIGILTGLAGALFAKMILYGQNISAKVSGKWQKFAFPAVCSLFIIFLAYLAGENVFGPGNGAAQEYLRGHTANNPLAFFGAKIMATVTAYWAGAAGGLFAPCLSMGAGLSAGIAEIMHYPIGACALIGMAGFLSGAIQSPITAFVIVFEMTGHPSLLLPIMLGSLIAYITVKGLKSKNLYSALADRYHNPDISDKTA